MYQIDPRQLPSNDQPLVRLGQTTVQAHMAVIRTLNSADYATLRAFAFVYPQTACDQDYLQRAFRALDWKSKKLLLDEKWAARNEHHYDERYEASYRGV